MGALLGYAAWMLTLTAVYFALPGLSVAFVYLLAAAVCCFVGSRLTLLVGIDRPQIPWWNAYTIVGLPTYALLAVALGLFARARSSGPDRRSLIDAVTVSAGLGLVACFALCGRPRCTRRCGR
jgi:hypothetical protein